MWELSIDHENKEQDCTPVKDLKKHIFGNCWCNPRLEIENGWKIWIHNAVDKREYFEKDTDTRDKIIN